MMKKKTISGIVLIVAGCALCSIEAIATLGGLSVIAGIITLCVKPKKSSSKTKVQSSPISTINTSYTTVSDGQHDNRPFPAPEAIHPPEPVTKHTSASTTYTIIKPKTKKALTALQHGEYTVFDLETTGLSPTADKIIEIAMVHHNADGTIQTYSSLFNPGCKIPSRITKITGITDADVENAPVIEDCLEDILCMIGDSPLVAHNAHFDMRFLTNLFCQAGICMDLTAYDTLEMARRAYPDSPDHKLATLIQQLNLSEMDQAHRALDDAMCTHALFCKCVDDLLALREAELAARRST